jgi:hypothetical protein
VKPCSNAPIHTHGGQRRFGGCGGSERLHPASRSRGPGTGGQHRVLLRVVRLRPESRIVAHLHGMRCCLPNVLIHPIGGSMAHPTGSHYE